VNDTYAASDAEDDTNCIIQPRLDAEIEKIRCHSLKSKIEPTGTELHWTVSRAE
jgi:hypothetical protein